MSKTVQKILKKIAIHEILVFLYKLKLPELKELKEHIKRQYAIGGRDEHSM